MNITIKDAISSFSEEDLYRLREDLSNNAAYLKKLVNDRLKELKHKKLGFCATCGADLSKKEKTYTLLFGPEDFKKKASFCELDCLEYFLENLKQKRVEEKSIKQ